MPKVHSWLPALRFEPRLPERGAALMGPHGRPSPWRCAKLARSAATHLSSCLRAKLRARGWSHVFSGGPVASIFDSSPTLSPGPEGARCVSPAVRSLLTSSLVPPRGCVMVSFHPHPGSLHSTGEAQKGTKFQTREVTCPRSHSEEMVKPIFELGQLDSRTGCSTHGCPW